jgi:hypothetical protein
MENPMLTNSPLVSPPAPIVLLTADNELRHPEIAVAATRDHDLIRRWADRRHAVPATGEKTDSGQANVRVTDGDAGIRFNFPGAGRFRPIAWDEWFGNFETHELIFVFERDRAGHAPGSKYRFVKLTSVQADLI